MTIKNSFKQCFDKKRRGVFWGRSLLGEYSNFLLKLSRLSLRISNNFLSTICVLKERFGWDRLLTNSQVWSVPCFIDGRQIFVPIFDFIF